MASEIGNKALLRRFLDRFNILDGKQWPSKINTDEVVVVASLGLREEATVAHQSATAALNGPTTNANHTIAFPAAPAPALSHIDTRGVWTWLIASSIRITMDAADNAANAGNLYEFAQWRMTDPGGTLTTILHGPQDVFSVQAGELGHQWALDGYAAAGAIDPVVNVNINRILIPPDHIVDFSWAFHSGATGYANGSAAIHGIGIQTESYPGF